jgi:hypothetical protein
VALAVLSVLASACGVATVPCFETVEQFCATTPPVLAPCDMNALVSKVDPCFPGVQTSHAVCGAYTAIKLQGVDTGRTMYFETKTGKLMAVVHYGMGGRDCEAGLFSGFWEPECPPFTVNPESCPPGKP